jgi:hypothetical protein
MTGLDLESYLILLRADLGAWAFLGVGTLLLALLVWLSFGSRRALRKCLALSVLTHACLALYGSTLPGVMRAMRPDQRDRTDKSHIQQIRIARVPQQPKPEGSVAPAMEARLAGSDKGPPREPSLNLAAGPLRLAGLELTSLRSEVVRDHDTPVEPPASTPFREPLDLAQATPRVALPESAHQPEERPPANPSGAAPPTITTTVPSADEVARLVPDAVKLRASRPGQPATGGGSTAPLLALGDLRRERAPGRPETMPPAAASAVRTEPVLDIPSVHATPAGTNRVSPAPALADLTGGPGSRSLTEVPRFYRSRLDANRSALAQQSGASAASEQAVERALDWLARHQDADGRWDGGTARFEDGTAVDGDDDFTVHCPPGQTCFGECAYFEADTALTGLALLTYLGAGYTHKDGKHATTVSKGLDFLLAQQKPDGDLRGPSRAVGMYCHAMATLALCEAYALSLDERLARPAERAIAFLVRSRARDGQSWRYLPSAPAGDTSILGWVVMSFKSAREVGLVGHAQADVRRGTLLWLDSVASGTARGLGRYQPWEPTATATMTAEAWVCRQFLGVGGPGPASSEAASYLLKHPSDKGDSNFYYWYYATLALYQHGGAAWTRWNEQTRDRIVSLQRTSGHLSGSWDPDESPYGSRGGRIYCTTLGALTLEVYYRYLRLYDRPSLPLETNAADGGADRPSAPRR